jgi:hypothetical protein
LFKPQVALNELYFDSIDIMYSLIIDKYIVHLNQYEYLLLEEFNFFITLKIK